MLPPSGMHTVPPEQAVAFFADPGGGLDYTHELTPTGLMVVDHVHASYEVYLLVSGDVTAYVEGRSYLLGPGDLLAMNRKELHRFVCGSRAPYDRIKILFVPEYVADFQVEGCGLLDFLERRKMGEDNCLRAGMVRERGIDAKILEIERSIRQGLPDTPLMVRAQFVELLVLLNRAFRRSGAVPASSGPHHDRILAVLTYLNGHMDEPVVLDRIAKEACMSKYHLCRVFRRHTGFTIHEYVLHKRVHRAKELLAQGRSALEACHGSGFNDYSSFYRDFRRIARVSPRDFVKALYAAPVPGRVQATRAMFRATQAETRRRKVGTVGQRV
jgi:AraC-like DNA-binding protein/mannose-6-phosphate isomerase-like protein (cupin superfamily)